jgi:hypothetical protein
MSKMGRLAMWSLQGAVVMYVWGFLSSLSLLDIEETCRRHNQPWVYDPDHTEALLPLSNPCNPSFDLVPSYVNPIFFGLLALTVVFTVIAAVQKSRREKKT